MTRIPLIRVSVHTPRNIYTDHDFNCSKYYHGFMSKLAMLCACSLYLQVNIETYDIPGWIHPSLAVSAQYYYQPQLLEVEDNI